MRLVRLLPSLTLSLALCGSALAVDAVTVDANGNMIIGTDPGGTELVRTAGVIRAGNVLSAKDAAGISSAQTMTATAFGKWHSIGASSAYAITLPNPSSYLGQCIGFRCDGTFSQDNWQVSITPSTTPTSDTIFGRAAGQPLVLLKGNSLILMANGAGKWTVVQANLDTDWILDTTGNAVPGALTTAPTIGTATIEKNQRFWKRTGGSVHLRYEFSKTANGTATNGSGIYLWSTIFTLDTSRLFVDNFANDRECGTVAGFGYAVQSTTAYQAVTMGVYDATRLGMVRNGNIVASGTGGLAANGVVKYIFTTFPLPVVNW